MNKTEEQRHQEYDEAKKQEQEERLRNAPKSITGTPLDQQEQFHPDDRQGDMVPNGFDMNDGSQTSHKSGGHSSVEKGDSARGGQTSGAGTHPVPGAFGAGDHSHKNRNVDKALLPE